tara:strand:- start:93 stop:467 length:375 start_codon:yes stop_codon:yes gene_type:complete
MMVHSVETSVQFYQKTLGFEQVMTVPESAPYDWAMLKQGEVTLMLQKVDSFSEEVPKFKDQEPSASLTLYMITDSVDTLYAHLQKTKVKILKEPHKTFYRMKEIAIEDPDGYTLVFAEACEDEN